MKYFFNKDIWYEGNFLNGIGKGPIRIIQHVIPGADKDGWIRPEYDMHIGSYEGEWLNYKFNGYGHLKFVNKTWGYYYLLEYGTEKYVNRKSWEFITDDEKRFLNSIASIDGSGYYIGNFSNGMFNGQGEAGLYKGKFIKGFPAKF